MTVPRLDTTGFEVWERREAIALRVVPYFVLAIATVLDVLAGPSAGRLGTLALAGLAAAWMLWMVTLHPAWTRRPVLMGVYYAGWVALAAALTVRDPFFGFFAFTGYLHAMFLPGRWKLIGVAATAPIMALSQIGGAANLTTDALPAYVAITVVNLAIAGIFTVLGHVVSRQNEIRKQMIDELAAANRRLEETMAENAGLQAQLLTQAREAGVLDERQRLAREIHDTLAQGLTGIITQIEAARQAAREPETWRRHLDTAAGLARESLAEARRSVHAMRPEPLEDARLPEALAEVVARWSAAHEVTARLATTGTPHPLHPEVEVTLLRTAQEGLANVAKHAKAATVVVTLSYMGDEVSLDVRDDGVGFDPRERWGFGLTAMRQRVDRLAGRLEIESQPGAGTAVSTTVPAIPPGAGGG